MIHRLLFLAFFFLVPYSLHSALPDMKGRPLDISLKNPVYKHGLITTDEGGIVQGKDFFIQAQHIVYTKKEGQEQLKAWGDLLLEMKGKLYRADTITIDFQKETIEALQAITRDGDWFITSEKVVLNFDGNGSFFNAKMSTGENEQDDWTLWSKEVQLKKNDRVDAKPVVFYIEKLPIMYLPSLSKSLKESNDLHLRYRVRYRGGTGLLVGVSCVVHETDNWNHRALVDYNFQDGIGAGLRSDYKADDLSNLKFQCLNYVAQSRKGLTDWPDTRYRLQGAFSSLLESPNIHIKGMYDKMSDKKMQSNFKEHRVDGAIQGMTQLTFTKPEDDYIARLNTRLRINDWQTVREELPLFTIHQHPVELGKSRLLLDEKFSSGHLKFVYPDFRNNFDTTRTELSQKVMLPLTLSNLRFTPWVGWRGVHYDQSPKGGAVVQAIGFGGMRMSTHLIGSTQSTLQTVEPYVDLFMSTSPRRPSDRNYIFDINDSFARVCYLRPGFEHTTFFIPDNHGFEQSLFSEAYATFFFNTPHLGSTKPRLHLSETWNATERTALKTGVEYDVRRHSFSFANAQLKYTLNSFWATTFEVRTQDKWYFRKIDRDNYDLESFRSPRKLLKTELSDPRTSCILGLMWIPNPELDFQYNIVKGFRKSTPHQYLAHELSMNFLLLGALRLHLSVEKQTGKVYGFSFRIDLGQQKGHTTMPFRKIGQGSYDIW